MKLNNIFSKASMIALLLTLLITSAVFADELDNDLDAGNDSAYETVTMTAGGNVTVNFTLLREDDDGADGCNATPGKQLTVYFDIPAGVSTNPYPSQLIFTGCGNANSQSMTFYSGTPGEYDIEVYDYSGGVDDGDYDLNDANFTLVVEAPDITPPVITPLITGIAGSNGWYTSNVHLAWSISDPESAWSIDSGCEIQYLTDPIDNPGTEFSCMATSAGGDTTQSVKIKIDKTGPTNVKLKVTSGTLLNGWYTDNVTVETTGSEDISNPVTCTADQLFTADTAGTAVTGSCTNQAGLTTYAEPKTIKIDQTAPTAKIEVVSGTLGLNGWYTSNVTLKTVGTDVSPVTCTDPNPKTVTDETDGDTITGGTCTDAAGNVSIQAENITIKLDKTAPTSATLTVNPSLPDGDNGWYTSNVSLTTTCGTESISTPVVISDVQTVTTDTTGKTFTGTCTNNAGLVRTSAIVTIKRDKTKPSIDWDSDIDDGEIIFYDKVPSEPDCDAYDAISGVSSCVITGYSEDVGYHKLTAKAVDNAGNKRVETRYYTVEGLTVRGFYSPFIMGDKVNSIKRGTKLEIRWEVFRGRKEVLTRSILEDVTIANIVCPLNTNKFPYNAKVKSYFTIQRGDILRDRGTFLVNWKLPKTVGECYTITARMENGQTISAWLKIKL